MDPLFLLIETFVWGLIARYLWKPAEFRGFPGGTVGKNPPAKAGDARDEGLIPELGRSPGGEYATHSSILGLGNPMDKGAWANSAHD